MPPRAALAASRLALFALALSAWDCAGGSGTRPGSEGNPAAGGSGAGGNGGVAAVGAPVTFVIDLGATRRPVSDAIYGINAYPGANLLVGRSTKWGLFRFGGNSYTAWNWETNDENAGSDLPNFPNYNSFMPTGSPDSNTAGAVLDGVVSIDKAQSHAAASLVTVSLQDYVAADHAGDVANPSEFAVSARFIRNLASKGSELCSCAPEAPSCVSGCLIDRNDGSVYQDEYVHFLKTLFPSSQDSPSTGIFFDLDNEPDAWWLTHREVWTAVDANNLSSYDEISDRNVTFATAIKAEWPEALVFGPSVTSLDGMVSAGHDYASSHKPTEFLDYYLTRMAAASASAGTRLLDVLDV
ncbi:MAG TPA: glycoside hydrolase family 44 protein, partial [Polyangiaceae bacterium]|nr:glycoside hydrolase family 44 protein [Polyangiaceae bacterium]